jgi:transglycosylase-like protein with SLT domain
MPLTPSHLAKNLLRPPGTPISDWLSFPPDSSRRSAVPTEASSFSLGSDSQTVIPSGVCRARNLSSYFARAGLLLLFWLVGPVARAEYIVLQSGLRLHVTSYQLIGEKYRLQLQGGWMDVSVADVAKIEPEEVFTPIPHPAPAAPAPAANQLPYHEFVLAAASRYDVDAELISSVMEVESHFNPKAVSPKNARGLMQLLPETAARLGVKDIFDPKENIDAGTHYLHDLLQLYNNDLTLALAAYNAGPDKVQKYGNVPPYRETVSYVNQVKRKYQKNKSAPPTKTSTQQPATKTAEPATPRSSPAPNPAPTAPTGPGTEPR